MSDEGVTPVRSEPGVPERLELGEGLQIEDEGVIGVANGRDRPVSGAKLSRDMYANFPIVVASSWIEEVCRGLPEDDTV